MAAGKYLPHNSRAAGKYLPHPCGASGAAGRYLPHHNGGVGQLVDIYLTLMGQVADIYITIVCKQDSWWIFTFFFLLIQFYVPFKIISAHMRRANQ